jgi:hypothetical protein
MKRLFFVLAVLFVVALRLEARQELVSSTKTITVCDWCGKEIVDPNTPAQEEYSFGIGKLSACYIYGWQVNIGKYNLHAKCYDEFMETVFKIIKDKRQWEKMDSVEK